MQDRSALVQCEGKKMALTTKEKSWSGRVWQCGGLREAQQRILGQSVDLTVDKPVIIMIQNIGSVSKYMLPFNSAISNIL